MIEHPQSGLAGRRIVVLLIDDQEFVATAIRQLLSGEHDLECHYCQTPLDAVRIANEIQPAVVLLDLVMPGLDGLAMLDLFRANPTTAATPIAVLSGSDDPDRRAEALHRGASDYLVKLPSREDLVACIRRHASGAHLTATPANAPRSDDTLDASVLASFRLVDPASGGQFVTRLIDQFLGDSAAKIAGLRSALQSEEGDRVRTDAHTLRGAAATIGARTLARLCSQMERHAARSFNVAVLSALMSEIEQEFARTREALAAERTPKDDV